RRVDVAAVLEQAREGEDRGRLARAQADRFLVRLDRIVRATIELVDPGEGDGRGVLVGAARGGALLEFSDEVLQRPILLPVELREALERKRVPRLREDDLRVAVDEDAGALPLAGGRFGDGGG